MKKYVAYYRVSTARQGRSGLGLEAQREMVYGFASSNNGVVIDEYTEIESGKNNNRIQLSKAIQTAKDNGATLLTAKLDRLSRDVEFIFNIKNSKIDFQCTDVPEMNTLTLGVTGTVAQYERERISERIKGALAAKKARGDKLGNARWAEFLTHDAQLKGAQANRLKALNDPANRKAVAFASVLRSNGLTLQEIADELNKNDFRTPQGKPWLSGSIHRILNRA